MEIVPNIHVIPSAIVNVFLIIDPDGLTLIDTGLPGHAKKVLKYIAELGRKPTDLKRIIITHADADHVGALAELKAATGATVYASPIEARAIAEGRASRPLKPAGIQKVFMRLLSPWFRAKPAAVDELVNDGDELPVLGGLRVIETHGHTPGHISLYSPTTQVLFGGDSLGSGDDQLHTSRGMNTWDESQARMAMRIQAALGAQIVCVGHGPVVMNAQGKFPHA
jgi:glyoxylase-like metal-dependent hydrolase (beta-lactamase superfamily II)